MTEPSAVQVARCSTRSQTMLPALVLGMAAFLTQFDVTAVVVAMPAIGSALGFGVAGFAWVMDAYSLAFTGTLLAAGALADRYAMLGGNAVFALASLACGRAWDGPSLGRPGPCRVSVRPLLSRRHCVDRCHGAIALIANVYPDPDKRTRAFARLGVMSGIAMALGPTLGGVIASWFGWPWNFLANLPACALIAWGVPRLVREARGAAHRPLDLFAVALLTGGLATAIEALLHGRSSPMYMAAGLLLSVLLFAAFVLQQRRLPQPILDPMVFARPGMIGIGILPLPFPLAIGPSWSICRSSSVRPSAGLPSWLGSPFWRRPSRC